MTWPRRPNRVLAQDGVTGYTFPTYNLRRNPTRPLRIPMAAVVGADYGYDHLAGNLSPKDFGDEQISFWIVKTSGIAVDTEFDSLQAVLGMLGRGQLVTIDDNAVERAAYVRVASLATYQFQPDNFTVARDVTITFKRLSDWLAVTPTTATWSLTASPQTLTLSNPGTAICRNAVWTWTPSGGSPSLNTPKLAQATASVPINGSYYQINRNLDSAAKLERVDCGLAKVQYSSNTGGTWADDYADLAIGTTQARFLELWPGTNTLTFTATGSPSGTLGVSFYPGYH